MTADAAAAPHQLDGEVRPNPYVGPRSLGREDRIYGRDREIRELRASLLAHRIVLLYAQSGAGKTSLIEAGLRPELEDLEFQVFPTIRVGYEPPPSDGGPDVNRYRLSVLASLEEARPPDQLLDSSELATISLDEYFRRLDEEESDRDPCLVFDQFEEVFTLDPTDWDEKEAFLRELGEALENRGRWALFSMREDFIAQLDPYLALIPTRLDTRYRIELLGPAAAKQAITEPAAALGVDFTDEAAEHLVNDLRRVQVQRGARWERKPGPNVEPVQLQVVCNRFWANLPADAVTIEPDDVASAGTVNEALAGFYDAQVKAAANRRGTREYEIRNWVDKRLITRDGFRTQVREGPGLTRNAVVRELLASHLIRADRIRGAEWYELSHDRFVEPIRESNANFARKRRSRRIGIGAIVVIVLLAAMSIGLGIGALSETPVALPEGVPAAFDEPISGTIAEPGEVMYYSFEASAGDAVLIASAPGSGLEAVVDVLDPDERLISSAAGTADDPPTLILQTPIEGTYLAAVGGLTGSTGSFELELRHPEVIDVVVGDTVPGGVGGYGDVPVYRFDVSAGDDLLIGLAPDADLTAVVDLVGPDGAVVSSATGAADLPPTLILRAPTGGRYLAAVSGLSGSSGVFDFGLQRPDVVEVAFGETVPGRLAAPGEVGVYRFDASEGDVLLLGATPDAELLAVVEVLDPLGGLIGREGGAADLPPRLILEIPTDGTYLAAVSGFSGSIGDFEFGLQRPDVIEVAVGETVSGRLAAPGDVGAYRFEAAPGEALLVGVVPDGGLDVVIMVTGPNGARVVSDYGGVGNAELLVTAAPNGGTFLATVSGIAGTTGGYEVALERPASTVIAFQGEEPGHILTPEDIGAFRFDAIAGQSSSVVVVPEGGLAASVVVTDPEGFQIAGAVGRSPETITLDLPNLADGRYFVTVTGLEGSTGPYVVRLIQGNG